MEILGISRMDAVEKRYRILDSLPGSRYGLPRSRGVTMSRSTRRRALEHAGLVHPCPEAVTAPLFDGREPFFLALDKVQVK